MNGKFRDIRIRKQDVWFGPPIHAGGGKGRTCVTRLRTAKQIWTGSEKNSGIRKR